MGRPYTSGRGDYEKLHEVYALVDGTRWRFERMSTRAWFKVPIRQGMWPMEQTGQ